VPFVIPFVVRDTRHYDSLTYEEINRGITLDIPYRRAPEPLRQPEHAPVKPAHAQPAFFYRPIIAEQRGNNMSQDFGTMMTGFHTIIDHLAGSPRGILLGFRNRRPIDRNAAQSWGGQQQPIQATDSSGFGAGGSQASMYSEGE